MKDQRFLLMSLKMIPIFTPRYTGSLNPGSQPPYINHGDSFWIMTNPYYKKVVKLVNQLKKWRFDSRGEYRKTHLYNE